MAANKKRRVNFRRDVEWVYSALSVENVQPEHAPSRGALALYRWATLDEATEQDFLKTFLPKLLPSKGELDQNERAQGGGRKIVELIDDLLEWQENGRK